MYVYPPIISRTKGVNVVARWRRATGRKLYRPEKYPKQNGFSKLKYTAAISNIDHLSLTKCNRVGPAAICRVVQSSLRLEWLSFYSCAHVSDDIVFFYLYENVENIIRTHKELMRNLVEFMDEPKRVPPEVRDELGIQLPDSESESPADSDSDSGDY